MGIIYKKKAIIILKPREKIPDFLILQIITNDDIGLHFNKDNIIFLIQEMDEVRQVGLHFKTFKNSLCRRVFPNEKFIEKLNRDITNRKIFSYNGQDADDTSIDFTCNIMSFDSTIPRHPQLRTRDPTPHVSPTDSIKRIEQQFKNMESKFKHVKNKGNYKSNSSSISNLSNNSKGLNLDNSDGINLDGLNLNGLNLDNSEYENKRRFPGRYNKPGKTKHKAKSKKPPGRKTKSKPYQYKGVSLNQSNQSSSRSQSSHSQSSRSQSTQGHSNFEL
jgi:hypothetical protein